MTVEKGAAEVVGRATVHVQAFWLLMWLVNNIGITMANKHAFSVAGFHYVLVVSVCMCVFHWVLSCRQSTYLLFLVLIDLANLFWHLYLVSCEGFVVYKHVLKKSVRISLLFVEPRYMLDAAWEHILSECDDKPSSAMKRFVWNWKQSCFCWS